MMNELEKHKAKKKKNNSDPHEEKKKVKREGLLFGNKNSKISPGTHRNREKTC